MTRLDNNHHHSISSFFCPPLIISTNFHSKGKAYYTHYNWNRTDNFFWRLLYTVPRYNWEKTNQLWAYQSEEADKESGVFPQFVVGSTAEVTELLELCSGFVPVVNHIRHVTSQHKWSSIPIIVWEIKILSNYASIRLSKGKSSSNNKTIKKTHTH